MEERNKLKIRIILARSVFMITNCSCSLKVRILHFRIFLGFWT